MSRLRSPGAALLAATLLFACSSDDADGDEPSGPDPVTFTDDIHPILQMKCGGSDCHDGQLAPILPGHGASDVQEAYAATQSTGTMDQLVYERIVARITSEEAMMPPNFANPPCSGMIGAPGCVTEAELALIEAWIEQGTPL